MAWVDTDSGGGGRCVVGLGLRGWGKWNFGIEIGERRVLKGELIADG